MLSQREFEENCDVFNSTVSKPSDRAIAHEQLVQFRLLPLTNPFPSHILQNSDNSGATYEAARCLRNGIISFFPFTKTECIPVIELIMKAIFGRGDRPFLPIYTIKELCKSFAVCVKKSWNFLEVTERQHIFETYIYPFLQIDLSGLQLTNKNIENYIITIDAETRQNVALIIMSAIVEEFSLCNRTTAFGLSLEHHINCHFSLQNQGFLSGIFQRALNFTANLVPNLINEKHHLFSAATQLVVEILQWNFQQQENYEFYLKFSFQSALYSDSDYDYRQNPFNEDRSSLALPPDWMSVLVESPAFLQMMFVILHRVEEDYLYHRWSICLTRMSSISLHTLSTQQRIQFLDPFIDGITKLISSCTNRERAEKLIYCIRTVIRNFKFDNLVELPSIAGFLKALYHLTVSFLDNADVDEELFLCLLSSWTTIVSSDSFTFNEQLQKVVSDYATEIYKKFVFNRILKAKEEFENDEDPYEDKEQSVLDSVNYLGRLYIGQSANLLIALLTEEFQVLQTNITQPQEGSLSFTFEKMFWFIDLASFLVSDACDGESPSIPIPVQQISQQAASDDADPIYCLIQLIFAIIHWHNQILIQQKYAKFLSSFVAETLLRFLSRWSKTYLLSCANEEEGTITNRLQVKYGGKQAGKNVLQFILQTCFCYLQIWGHDLGLATATCDLLIQLSALKPVRELIHSLEDFHNIIRIYLGDSRTQPSSFLLACSNKTIRNLTQSLIQFGDNCGFSETQTITYYNRIFVDFETKFFGLTQHADFAKNANHPNTISHIVHYIQILRGVASAHTYTSVFKFCSKFFPVLIGLTKVYGTHNIINNVLHFFQLFVERHFDNLNEDEPLFCQCIHNFFLFYRELLKENIKEDSFEEEERTDQLVCIIKIVSSLAERLGSLSNEANQLILLCLQVILPKLSDHILQYPKLCKEYFYLVNQLCSHPSVTVALPFEIFHKLLESIKRGVECYHEDTTFSAFESFKFLLFFNHNSRAKSPTRQSALADQLPHAVMEDTMQKLLHLMLFKEMRADCLEIASDCLLALIVDQKEIFQKLVIQIIQSHPNETLAEHFTRLTEDIDFGNGVFTIANLRHFQNNVKQLLLNVRNLLLKK